MKITREEESEIKGTPGVSAPAPTETPEQPAAAAKPAARWAAIPLWGRVLLILGIALLLLVFVGYAALQGMLGRIRRASATEAVSQQEETFESDENADDTLSPEDVIWNGADTSVMQDKDIVNLLLIGQDRREGQDRQRADSMIMVTLNKKTKQISMTSFMRDLYVQIPGYSDNRINATYAFGGMDLLDSTLNTNFGVELAGNVEVDFGEFQTLIDSIGGIDLELTQDEADYICGRKRDVTYPQQLHTDWNLHEGVNHLTGEQALIHARNRSLGNDYARTDRQRAVLMAIINKVKQMDAVSIVNFINQVLPLLTTDMTSGEILGYAMEALQMNFDSEHSYRIPAEGTYTGAVIRGMQVLVPDLAANQTYLMDVLYHTDNNQ